jgi:hypothetical protein
MVLELLRVLIMEGGYYGTLKPELNMIMDVQFIGEMAHPMVSNSNF